MNNLTRLSATLVLAAVPTLGCVQNGARPSIWPSLTKSGETGAPSMASSVTGAAKGVKGQVASMGTAVSSAYGKAKNSLTSAFTTTPSTANDPTSLNSKPATIGPEIYVAQGHLYESTGQFPKALDNFSKALEIEKTNLAALTSVARLHARQNETEKAAEFYKKAIAVNPGDATLHVEYGDCQRKLGQLDNARDSYLTAVNLQPKERGHRIAMANVLLEEGRDQEALTEISQVETPAMANYQMAYLYFGRQKLPEAQKHLQAALEIDPNMQPARDLLNQMGGVQTAQQAYGLYQNAGNMVQAVRGLAPPSVPTGNANVPYSASGPAGMPATNTVR